MHVCEKCSAELDEVEVLDCEKCGLRCCPDCFHDHRCDEETKAIPFKRETMEVPKGVRIEMPQGENVTIRALTPKCKEILDLLNEGPATGKQLMSVSTAYRKRISEIRRSGIVIRDRIVNKLNGEKEYSLK